MAGTGSARVWWVSRVRSTHPTTQNLSQRSSGDDMNTLAEAATEKDVYLSEFNRLEKELARRGRPGVQRLRRAAIARFDELGFPTSRNEDWKFTSLAALTKVPFRPAEPAGDSLKAPQLAHVLGMDAACRLVFVDGYFAPELSAMAGLPAGV